MNSKCRECYWLSYNKKLCIYQHDLNNKEECSECIDFSYNCSECKTEQGLYKYTGKVLCEDCLLNELNHEVQIEKVTTYEYFLNGEYIGSDNNMNEVIDILVDEFDIEVLED